MVKFVSLCFGKYIFTLKNIVLCVLNIDLQTKTVSTVYKAFDCVEHDKLISILNCYDGIRGHPLKLIRSYLSNRAAASNNCK